jgi:hypothetical protein
MCIYQSWVVSTFEHTSWYSYQILEKKSYPQSMLLAFDLSLNLHTNLVLVLGSKADFWLLCDKYIPDVEIDIALVFN